MLIRVFLSKHPIGTENYKIPRLNNSLLESYCLLLNINDENIHRVNTEQSILRTICSQLAELQFLTQLYFNRPFLSFWRNEIAQRYK